VAGRRLEGCRVVLDLCWGSATACGEAVFRELGAEVQVLHGTPDGSRINVGCGSTHLEPLRRAVVESGAAMGFAFDGDADRMLAVDGQGRVVDGDQILYLWGSSLLAEGQLPANRIVATVMSNMGLERFLGERGLKLLRTAVGDRYVGERMREEGCNLGGEQSGHIVFSQYATTGDGVLTGLHLAAKVASSGKSLRELVAVMPNFPQVLINVPGVDKSRVDSDSELQAFVAQATAELGDRGRVLLRASGTENLVRVMVEAADQGTAQSWAERIAGLVEKRLAL
jgi:phosphoglucosamine mutase